MIYGERIRQVREFCGLKQTELAASVGVTQATVAYIENDLRQPSESMLNAISERTGFLPSFFEREPVEDFPLGSLSFRARQARTLAEETKAYQYAKLIFEQVRRMIPKVDLPRLKLRALEKDPATAAKLTRMVFGFSPEAPVKNLTVAMEKCGVLVFVLPEFFPHIDAFSIWTELDGKRPIVVIDPNKSMDRLRFSMAHELGHLVMHQSLRGPLKILEKEADVFAGELLLPTIAMEQELIEPVTLAGVAKLKPRWGVSMQSLIYRAREVGKITERQATYLFTQMSARGWKTKEPSNLDIKRETPQLVRRMIESSFDSREDYSSDLGLSATKAIPFMLNA